MFGEILVYDVLLHRNFISFFFTTCFGPSISKSCSNQLKCSRVIGKDEDLTTQKKNKKNHLYSFANEYIRLIL